MTLGKSVQVAPVASSAPSPGQTTASTVPVQQTAPTISRKTVQVTSIASGPPSKPLFHHNSMPHLCMGFPALIPHVLQSRIFQRISRSTLLGWLGCNACSFIALHFGNMYFLSSLEPPSDHVTLDHEWQVSLREAILKGNEIHDDLYDNDESDLAVDEAVELAGDECGVNCS